MAAPTSPLLLLRADAGPGIGSGHASRLLALAREWVAAGGRAALLSVNPSSQLTAQAGEAGTSVVAVPRRHPDRADLAALLEAVGREGGSPWVAVDGYFFDAGYLAAVRAAGARLLRVDDAPRGAIPCDAFLDQNAGAEASVPVVPVGALSLLGPRWALLRHEFARTGGRSPERAGAARLLISFGGEDPEDGTGLALRALRRVKTPFEAVVIVGPDNPRAAALAELAAGLPVRLERAADMPALMATADLALLGGGVTMLEACAAGLPAVVVTVADNQEAGAAALAGRSLVRLVGRSGGVDEAALARELDARFADPQALARLSAAGRAAVDGLGASRVAAILRSLSAPRLAPAQVRFRPASAEDSREVWRIVNDPTVRANSFHPEPIPWETHSSWFESHRGDPREAFVVADAGCVAGHFRLTPDSAGVLEVHFYVHAAFRGKGLGVLLLKAAQTEAFRRTGIDEVVGTVLPGNEASIRAFLSSGFARAEASRPGAAGLRFHLRRPSVAVTDGSGGRSADA